MIAESDITVQNMLPPDFDYLGAVKLSTINNSSPIETLYYARSKKVNGGKRIEANDLKQLATKCWRVHFRPNKTGVYTI